MDDSSRPIALFHGGVNFQETKIFNKVKPMSTLTPDRLTAVDLTALPNEHMSALRREAIRRGISMADLVASLINDASARLVAPKQVTSQDIIREAAKG